MPRVWGKRCGVGIDAGNPGLIGLEAHGWYRWMNLIVGFQGRVRNARGQMGAWGGTLDGNGRLEDGWTQESVLRVERMLLLTSTVKAWDRTWSKGSVVAAIDVDGVDRRFSGRFNALCESTGKSGADIRVW